MAGDLIALFGHPGSGKTTIGEELVKLKAGHRISFAGPLRVELAKALAGVEDFDSWAPIMAEMSDPETKDRYRPLQQAWGSFRRYDDANYWTRQVEKAIRLTLHNDPEKSIIIDDCRFPNEYKMLADQGFVFVLLEPGETTRQLPADVAAHESERYWPEFHFDIKLPYVQGPYAQAMTLSARVANWRREKERAR